MTLAMWQWGSDQPQDVAGVMARPFWARGTGYTIPGVLWHSDDSTPNAKPLVLVQHGGSGHKADAAVLEIAAEFVTKHGFMVASIDGPIHGDRAPQIHDPEERRGAFLQYWRRDPGIDAMVADWIQVSEGLCLLDEVDAARIGWYGVSMGTAYGIPVVAQCPFIAAAVLGKWAGDYPNSHRLMKDALDVQCPVLFIQRWHDEIFSRQGILDLFDALGSTDKRLHVYPGSHFDRAGEPLEDAIMFLSRRLQN